MTAGHHDGPRAGWYRDPEGPGERWWNGESWTNDRRTGQGQPQQPYGQHQVHAQQHPVQDHQHGQFDNDRPHDQLGHEQGMRCVNCQWTDFTTAQFVLTPGGKVFDRGVGMATAQCLICRRCGFISWFATR